MSAPWSILNYPSTATAAVATQTAPTNAGTTGLCTRLRALQASVACGATAQTPVALTVRDGGVSGTVVAEFALAAAADGFAYLALTDLDIRSTPGNDLTVQFEAAGVAASQMAVNAQGDFVSRGYPAFQA